MNMVDVIERGAQAKHLGMSDDQLANERDAQWKLKTALQIMRDSIRAVNAYSAVVSIPMDEWEAFLHDSVPTEKDWNEKIAEART